MEIAIGKIMSIWQEGTVTEYSNEFRFLFNQVKNSEEISEYYAIYLFMNGLKPEIRDVFITWHQYSCIKVEDVISLALKIDSNGLQDSFSPFDPNSSFYNKDLEFDINIPLNELMKDNELFRIGMIQETCDNIVQETIVEKAIDDDVLEENGYNDEAAFKVFVEMPQGFNNEMNVGIGNDSRKSEKDGNDSEVEEIIKENVNEIYGNVIGEYSCNDVDVKEIEKEPVVDVKQFEWKPGWLYCSSEKLREVQDFTIQDSCDRDDSKERKGNQKAGRYIKFFGSTKACDPWKKKKQLNCMDTSWVGNIECINDETIGCKFYVEQVDRNMVWEVGDYHEWKPVFFYVIDYQDLMEKKSVLVLMIDVIDFDQQIQPGLGLWSDTGWTKRWVYECYWRARMKTSLNPISWITHMSINMWISLSYMKCCFEWLRLYDGYYSYGADLNQLILVHDFLLQTKDQMRITRQVKPTVVVCKALKAEVYALLKDYAIVIIKRCINSNFDTSDKFLGIPLILVKKKKSKKEIKNIQNLLTLYDIGRDQHSKIPSLIWIDMGWVSWMRVTASAVNPGADEAEEVFVVHQTDSTDNIEGSKATVAFGANKDEEDKEEEIALHVAYGYGEVKCAKILLGVGAKADVLDKKKNIVLHYAADYSRSLSINDRLPMARTYTHLSGAQHQPPHGGMSSVLNEEYTMLTMLVSAFTDVVSQKLMGQVGFVQIFDTCD